MMFSLNEMPHPFLVNCQVPKKKTNWPYVFTFFCGSVVPFGPLLCIKASNLFYLFYSYVHPNTTRIMSLIFWKKNREETLGSGMQSSLYYRSCPWFGVIWRKIMLVMGEVWFFYFECIRWKWSSSYLLFSLSWIISIYIGLAAFMYALTFRSLLEDSSQVHPILCLCNLYRCNISLKDHVLCLVWLLIEKVIQSTFL